MTAVPAPPITVSNWLTSFRKSADVTFRLFCAPYAGGGPHVFQRWPDSLPEGVEVCSLYLPGRGKRLTEPPLSQMMPLVAAATEAIVPFLDKPFALFGHSMGGLISFGIARTLENRYGISPQHLFVSASYAPHLSAPHPMHHLPEKEFREELRSLNGIPTEVMNNDEMMELVLPSLRADFTATETYVHEQQPLLACPITAFGGIADPLASHDQVDAWRLHTTGQFRLHMLPGDHFFILSQPQLLLNVLAAELKPL